MSSLSLPNRIPWLTTTMAAHTGTTTHSAASALPIAQTSHFGIVTLYQSPTATADCAGTSTFRLIHLVSVRDALGGCMMMVKPGEK